MLRTRHPDAGQAAVELVALLPLVAALAALAWQAVVAAQAVWLAGAAARAAARAQAVGGDPLRAARGELPGALVRDVGVTLARDGAIRVAIGVPAVVGGVRLGQVRATARFAPQGG